MLHDGLETRPGSCARNVDSIRKGYACLGEELNMLGAISEDFGKTEQCNYYIFPSQISTLQYAMAFRVSLKLAIYCIIFVYEFLLLVFRRKVLISKRLISNYRF